jgi:hypothetical protein
MKEFNLGGVSELPMDAKVIAAIIYKIPIHLREQLVTLSIGLAEQGLVNTIFGILLLRTIKIMMFLKVYVPSKP